MRLLLAALLLPLFGVPAALAQTTTLTGGGYLDYAVRLAPDSSAGEQGFVVRRGWASLTAQGARRTTFRLRLETDDATVPALRLFEAFVRLDSVFGAARGAHTLTAGLQPTYVTNRANRTWGYRFLLRPALTGDRVFSSRDLGVQLDGPVGPLHYAVSFTGSRGPRSVVGDEGRLSGALATPDDAPVQAVLGLDQVWQPGGTRTVATVAAAYVSEAGRVGVETYLQRGAPAHRHGVGVHAARRLAPRWFAAGRLSAGFSEATDRPLLEGVAGAVYRHSAMLDVSPNVVLSRPDGEDMAVTARLTASLRF